jgi:hypothetical protein
MRTILTAVLFAALALGQITVNVPALDITKDGTVILYKWMLQQQRDGTTFLSDDCTASATSIRVEDASGINVIANSVLLIDKEAFTVTAKVGRVLTVTRASVGTEAAAHKGRITTKNEDGSLNIVNAGDLVTVLKYRSPQLAMRQWVVDKMAALMAEGGYPTAVAQDAVINTARAAKDAAVAEAVK